MASALKVGILTFHKCINNGSYWQAHCLVEHLRSRGHAIIGAQGRLVDEDTDEGRFAALPDTPVRPSVDRRITELRGRQDCAVARSFADAVAADGAGAKLRAMPLLAAADSIRVTGSKSRQFGLPSHLPDGSPSESRIAFAPEGTFTPKICVASDAL